MAGNLFDEIKPSGVEPEREAEAQLEPKNKNHLVWQNMLSNGLPWVRVTCPLMHYTEEKYTVSDKTVFRHCRMTEPIPPDVLQLYEAQKATLRAGHRLTERWTVWWG